MADLRALLDAATQGPWHFWHGDDDACMNAYGITSEPCDHDYTTDRGHSDHTVALTLLQSPRLVDIGNHSGPWASKDVTDTWRWVENADLIVAAVNALPALLDVVDAARDLHTLLGGVLGQPTEDGWAATCDAHDALDAALARLDEATR